MFAYGVEQFQARAAPVHVQAASQFPTAEPNFGAQARSGHLKRILQGISVRCFRRELDRRLVQTEMAPMKERSPCHFTGPLASRSRPSGRLPRQKSAGNAYRNRCPMPPMPLCLQAEAPRSQIRPGSGSCQGCSSTPGTYPCLSSAKLPSSMSMPSQKTRQIFL